MTAAAGTRPRRRYIDWARGLAVLIMIGAHTLDAWTRVPLKSTLFYQQLSLIGGFAAPMFLWLAGLSLAMSAERTLQRTGRRREATVAVVSRAAEIFILAFLFRLQAFVVSPGSWMVTVFRVDILNVMGVSMAVAGLIWGAAGTARRAAVWAGAAAVAVAMVTPVVRTAGWVEFLPLWFQWHLRPFGDHTTFTLLPWGGFVLAGTAAGALFTQWREPRDERLGLLALGGVGAALIWLGFFTAARPSLYAASSFWTSSPTFFAIRVGVLMVALALLFLVDALVRAEWPGSRALAVLGQNSLFIYWIHIEIVYGYLTWPLRLKLPIWGTAVAYLIFTVVMYQAIGLRDRVVELWRARGLRKATAGPVPA